VHLDAVLDHHDGGAREADDVQLLLQEGVHSFIRMPRVVGPGGEPAGVNCRRRRGATENPYKEDAQQQEAQ
jgi:hypothetical protein